MRKIFFVVLVSIPLFYSCGNHVANQATTQATTQAEDSLAVNTSFNKYKEAFIENLWKVYPGWASSVGYHKYDSVLIIPDSAYHQQEVDFANQNLDSLKKFDITKLSPANKIDFDILENAVQGFIFSVNEFREYEWNPAFYNVGGSFADIMQNKKASNAENLHAIYSKMANVPAYYAMAKKMIKNPTMEHTDLGMQQNEGSIGVFKGMIMDSLKKTAWSKEEVGKFKSRIKETVDAIEGYVSWLKKDIKPTLKPGIARSFRIGKELYDKKFQYDIESRYTAEEIYKKALKSKDELHAKMREITKQIYNKYFPTTPLKGETTLADTKSLIDEISKKHVSKDSFQIAIENEIPILTKFVADKNLLYMDPAKPLVVRKEPAYMAGVAGASMSSPGPYDKEGNSYYNVGSLAGYTPEEAESYLREYNYYVLQILSIHEAIPGHYVQLVYSNQSPSIVKSIFGNGAMIEGWAVYSELMMMENGFGKDAPEMWLMYYKWHLRSVCNTILDYQIQVLGMKKEEAIKFLVDEAFQQKQEAENKWRRATLTQVQLTSYFTGFTEIYELREEMKARLGSKFNLKDFNEKFLSYGSAPVKYIQEMMLAN